MPDALDLMLGWDKNDPGKKHKMRLLFAIFIIIFFGSSTITVAEEPSPDAESDPFSDVFPRSADEPESEVSKSNGFFSENFGFRKEIMLEFGVIEPGNSSSRQSIGFEIQKKFSSETKTYLGIDFQGRLVRRDGYVGVINDKMGMDHPGWKFEYHNAYLDLYDIAGSVGAVNSRIGHFYVPFGLNLVTDTHGTLLQLSNERNFGFERDWYAGFWGNLSANLRYDIYYLTGTGNDLRFKGQSGLGAGRISLANRYLSEYGLEAGVSFIGGERVSSLFEEIATVRAGVDGRYRKAAFLGLMTWTTELSGGRDNDDPIFTQLHQLDYLHSSRRWGLASQYRWFWQKTNTPATDSSLITEASWYFDNDVAGSNLQWIKVNCENQFAVQKGNRNVIWAIQYYRYW